MTCYQLVFYNNCLLILVNVFDPCYLELELKARGLAGWELNLLANSLTPAPRIDTNISMQAAVALSHQSHIFNPTMAECKKSLLRIQICLSIFKFFLTHPFHVNHGIKEKEKGKVNQLDVGNEKDQQNTGSNNPRTSKNSKNKTK